MKREKVKSNSFNNTLVLGYDLNSSFSSVTKENNAVKSAPTGVEYSLASSSSNENAGNFHDALMNIYRHLLNL